MSEQCKKGIMRNYHLVRCTRNAVRDGYCKQHHPETIQARDEKSNAYYKQKMENSPITKLNQRAEKSEQQRDALLQQLKIIVFHYGNSGTTGWNDFDDASQLIAEIEQST